MLYACVRTFDVTSTIKFFLRTKQGLTILFPEFSSYSNPRYPAEPLPLEFEQFHGTKLSQFFFKKKAHNFLRTFFETKLYQDAVPWTMQSCNPKVLFVLASEILDYYFWEF